MTDPREMPEPPKQVADAPKGNWVDRFAPAWSVPYLRLSRADRPIGTWLLYIPCLWGVALAAMGDGFRLWDLWIVVSCGVGAFLMRGAGCTWNDITDRDFDGQVARTRSRPIPSGQVTVKLALVWMVVAWLLMAWALTCSTPPATIWLCSLSRLSRAVHLLEYGCLPIQWQSELMQKVM